MIVHAYYTIISVQRVGVDPELYKDVEGVYNVMREWCRANAVQWVCFGYSACLSCRSSLSLTTSSRTPLNPVRPDAAFCPNLSNPLSSSFEPTRLSTRRMLFERGFPSPVEGSYRP